jgi:hypothetical protein
MKNSNKKTNTENIQYCFSTNLSCEAVAEIISSHKPSFCKIGICGIVYRKEIEISYRSFDQNAGGPIFSGTISENLNGTMVSGYFRRPWNYMAPKIAKGFLALMFIITLISGVTSEGLTSTDIIVLLLILCVPLAIIIFISVLEKVMKSQGEEAKKMILYFFEKELLATLQDCQADESLS